MDGLHISHVTADGHDHQSHAAHVGTHHLLDQAEEVEGHEARALATKVGLDVDGVDVKRHTDGEHRQTGGEEHNLRIELVRQRIRHDGNHDDGDDGSEVGHYLTGE